MTEEQALDWLSARFSADGIDRLHHFVALLIAEADQQNLIATSTVPHIWARHIVDCAQLALVGPEYGAWVDIGAGAGLPGLVVACLRNQPTVLVEPRKLRCEFLASCVDAIGLSNVDIRMGKAQSVRLNVPSAVISARAVAALTQLLSVANHLSSNATIWILPKGRNAQSEVAEARLTWQGTFHVEPSVVDPTSGIVVATKVARRKR